jgi:ATP-dependent DNA helicase RecQ
MNIKAAPAKPAPAPKVRQPPQVSVATGRIFELFDEGLRVDEVALQTDRAISTITSYLEKYVVARRIDSAQQWLSAGNIQLVEKTVHQLGRERLKPIYDALEQSVSYEDIRVIIACLVNRELA